MCAINRNYPDRISRVSKAKDPGADPDNNGYTKDRTSGLKRSWVDDDNTVVELFRNCACGSTLMDFFMDRRDCTARGVQRRTVVGRLLDTLEKNGLPRDIARQELTGVMNGNHSERLEALGIQLKSKGD